MKIISLVPSITELLFTLGLNEEVAGITKFCVHPEIWFRNKPRVGGTKNINPHKIRALNPDLIIANKEENVKEQIEELARDFKIILTDVNNYDEALQMIHHIGVATGKEKEAEQLVNNIQKKFSSFQIKTNYKAAYFIWQKPWMVAGGDTFINSMMQRAGFENVFINKPRYPETTIEELNSLQPEYILLSSEPYPFQQKHVVELKQYLPHSNIILVDGEMFSWYGSRMLKAADYFNNLLSQL